MKKILAGLAAATMIAAPIASAEAHQVRDHYGHKIKHNHGRYYKQQHRPHYRDYRYDQRVERYWRGRDGRVYCQRRDGTVGVIVGAAVGGLLGHSVDRGEGTVIGGVLGALLGREIVRGEVRCR